MVGLYKQYKRIICVLFLHYATYSIATETGCNSPHEEPFSRLTIDKIEIVPHTIFDESDPDTLALHRWANWLHVDTQESVVASRLPFKEGDEVDTQDLQEAERIIRSESYLRDAKVDLFLTCEADNKTKVSVKTWDNWSLLPTISFSRKGGENRFAVGFNEDNLLGMGIRTRVLYQSDAQRTGYRFTFRAPVPNVEHATAYVDLEDNDDGQRVQLIYDQPFYTHDANNSAYLNLLSDKRSEEVFQNGGTRNIYDYEGKLATASYGILWSLENRDITRLRFGISYEQARFYLPEVSLAQDPLYLPMSRENLYPWLEVQWKEFDYRVLTDIKLINQKEDINLGWQHSIKVGVQSGSNDSISGAGVHFEATTQAGFEWPSLLVLFNAHGRSTFNVYQDDPWQVNAQFEGFYRPTKKLGGYLSLTALASDNRLLDSPHAVGGESGVRGYPLQFQHGDNSISLTTELRYYPQLTFWKLFDLGFVAFADVGKAWSGVAAQQNDISGVLSSVGLGARIYSNRSSHRNVIHFDFAKPLASGDRVDSWQWRVTVKESF